MSGKGALTRNPPSPKCWTDCSAGTCASLIALLGEGDHTGKRLRFNDSFGTSRIFKVAGQNGHMWLLHHANVVDEGEVHLFVRQIALKLVRAAFNLETNEIEITSLFSGDVLMSLKYEPLSRATWGHLTELVNKQLGLPEKRTVLFPPAYMLAQDMEEWQKKPRVRVQVRAHLGLSKTMREDKKVRFVKKKQEGAKSKAKTQ